MNSIKSGVYSITSKTGEMAVIGAPLVFSSIYQMAAQDPRDEDGILALGMGLTMILASRPATLGSCFKKNVTRRAPANSSFRIIRLFFAIVGVAMVGYGIYAIVRRIIILNPVQAIPPQASSVIPKRIKVEMKTCEERVFWAHNQLMLCPEANQFWVHSNKAGNFTIACDSTILSRALSDPHNRKILIHPDNWQVPNIIRSFLMELVNMKNAENKGYLAEGCKMTSEQYMIYSERLEYRSIVEVNQIAQKCIDKGLWSIETSYLNHFIGPNPDWATFELYLEAMKKSGHADLHRQHHKRNCR